MWESFLRNFNGLRIGIHTDTIGRLDGIEQIAALTSHVQHPAVRTNDELVNPVEPVVIVCVSSSPLKQSLFEFVCSVSLNRNVQFIAHLNTGYLRKLLSSFNYLIQTFGFSFMSSITL